MGPFWALITLLAVLLLGCGAVLLLAALGAIDLPASVAAPLGALGAAAAAAAQRLMRSRRAVQRAVQQVRAVAERAAPGSDKSGPCACCGHHGGGG